MFTNRNYSCIAIAIFYNQKQWHVLIRELIKPLIKELREKNFLESFYLFAEKKKGEHIKVVMVSSAGKGISGDYLTSRINRFLLDHPSDTGTTTCSHFPLKAFFTDFPNNSVCLVHWDAINFQHEHMQHPFKSAIRHHVSKAIAGALDQEEISVETLYTFIIYMQLALVRAVCPDIEHAINAVENLKKAFPLRFEDEHEDEESDPEAFGEGFRGLFEQNKALLNEIIMEIWLEEPEASLSWLAEWERDCRYMASRICFEEQYYQASFILYKHLGFPSNAMLTNSTLHLICDSLRNKFLNRV